LVSVFAPRITAALGGAVSAADLVKDWEASPNQTDAYTWLLAQGIDKKLSRAIAPILQELWANAWELGVAAARQVTGHQGHGTQQAYQQMLQRYASTWASQILSTLLKGVAKILVAGGAGMAAAVAAFLASQSNALRIAQTELTRAMAEAAAEIYRQAGVQLVQWVTEPPDPCPLCIANEESGPHFLGQVFPSGAIAPPQHPRCRCALLPVLA
jgi:hypothetical protein